MHKTQFNKAFERDTTFILQSLWARDLLGDNYLKFGEGNPHTPLWVHYFTGENTQIWENAVGMQWFADKLLEKNVADAGFMQHIVEDQLGVLPQLKFYWEKESALTSEEVATYLALLRRAMLNLTLYFYTGLDARTPESIQEVVVRMRQEEGEFEMQHRNFVHHVMGAKGYSETYANVLLPEEFLDIPTNDELERRSHGLVMVDGKELFVGSLEAYATLHPEFEFVELNTQNQNQVSEVRGQIAQKGKVVGRVRVVRNRGQANTTQEGEVIVSPMTTPDFIAGMHKAAAFVTDEGGIVCHAAIVAREMKKPCVIGTKLATKVFKDGDLVEVDANAGVVRILERKGI